jgi:hypothetical protein
MIMALDKLATDCGARDIVVKVRFPDVRAPDQGNTVMVSGPCEGAVPSCDVHAWRSRGWHPCEQLYQGLGITSGGTACGWSARGA